MVRLVQTPEERQQAFRIRKQVFVEEQGVPAQLELDAKDEQAVHWLLWREGEPVATARLLRQDKQGKVGRVAVLPEWRSHGLGREVMEEIHNWGQRQGLEKIVLDAQVQVIAFYEKLGYESVGEPFEEAGILHKRMVRWLV
ncbi:GNAT family N-acetyltransferase [bacterium]|nr:GNAT family N-acetyltransferase [bacterium]